jgi:hypothetical protein
MATIIVSGTAVDAGRPGILASGVALNKPLYERSIDAFRVIE